MSIPSHSEEQLLAIRLAVTEVHEKTWGSTEQYLKSNVVECDTGGEPRIARVDSISRPGAHLVYFPIVNESYFYVVTIQLDQFGKLVVTGNHVEARTVAKLVIVSETLLPDTITGIVGLTPTYKRELDPKGKAAWHRRESAWVLEAQAGQPDCIESKVKSLLGIVLPRAKSIASLESSCSILVQLVYDAWISNGHLGGLFLNPEELSAISSLRASLDFDTYASGPWLQND